MAEYSPLIDAAVAFYAAEASLSDADRMALIIDRLSAAFGVEISKIVPGYVSTEVSNGLEGRLYFI